MALPTNWQKLKVQARGLIYSASARADKTILAIMCQHNQQKNNKSGQIQSNSHSASLKGHLVWLKLKQLSVTLTNIALCGSQNRIRELFSQKGWKSLFYLCSGR